MLKIDRIDNFEEFLKLEPIWNTLLAQSDCDMPFLTFEWFSCWWKTFGLNSELILLLIKDKDQITAIAPLMRKKIKWRWLPVVAISFIANYHSNRCGLIIAKNEKRGIFDLIFKYFKESECHFDILCFDFIMKDSMTDKLLKEALSVNMMKYRAMNGDLSPYIQIQGSWDDYKKSMSSNFRHKLNRTKNKFERHGKYEIRKFTNDLTSEAMQDLAAVSRKTWKFKEKTAIASNTQYMDLYSSIAKIFSKKEWLNIWILKLGNKPISFILNFVYKNKVYSSKIGFDEEYADFAPGEFLNAAAIKDCFDNKMDEYDWLGENLPFKTRWTPHCRPHIKYRIFQQSAYGKILSSIELSIIPKIKKFFHCKII